MKLRTFLLALILATASIGFISLNAQAEEGDSQTIYGAIVYNVAFNSYSPGDSSADSDFDAIEDEIGVNKIGIKGKKGNTSYQFEFGFRDENERAGGYNEASEVMFLRIGTVAVDVGGINIKVGQDYNPYTQLGSCLVASPVFSAEKLAGGYDKRTPQVMISMSGIYLSLIQPAGRDSLAEQELAEIEEFGAPTTIYVATVKESLVYGGGYFDVTLPKIAVGYMGKIAGIDLGAGFAYQTMKIDDEGGPNDGESVDAWAANLKASGQMGAIGFKFSFIYSSNPFEFGFVTSTINTKRTIDGTDPVDTTGMGGFLEVSYNFGMGTVQAGIAYQQTSNDGWSDDDKEMSYFVQIPIALSPNFKVAPGLMVQDLMTGIAGEDEDKNTYFGLAFVGSF